MNKTLIPSLLITGALLAGCNPEPATDTTTTAPAPAAVAPAPAPVEATVAKEDAVAMVNGKAISKAAFKTLEDEITLRSHGQKFPKEQLLEELIQREVLVQDAQKKNLDKSAEFNDRMDMAERSLLSQANLQDYLKANPITDTEIKAVYDKEVLPKMSGTEYKARHILVKTEDEAKKLIAELSKGAKFEELAKKHSLDPSKDQGGDLGWFTEEQMVEPFSKATVGLEKGKFTQIPVQTQFGWHVILREDSRAQTPPAFDEAMKEQLRPALQQKKVQAMLEGLRKAAKVEILMPMEAPKPATAPDAGKAAVPGSEAAPPATDNAKAAEPVKTDVVAPATDASKEPVKTEATAPATVDAKPTEPAKTEATVPATIDAKPAEPAKTDVVVPATDKAVSTVAEPAKK